MNNSSSSKSGSMKLMALALFAVMTLTSFTLRADESQQQSEGKGLPFMLLATLSQSLNNSVSNSSQGFFDNLLNWLFGKVQPRVQTQGYSQNPYQQPVQGDLNGSFFSGSTVPSVPPTAQMQADAVQYAVSQPMLAMKAAFLTGADDNAQIDSMHGEVALKSQEGVPMQFDVTSGDVFALYFTPSTPGLVRLTSVDSARTEVLDTYLVKPGLINRLPREGAGGIVVDNNAGQERLRIEYEPCLPEALVNDETVKPFAGKLARCGQLLAASATRGGTKSFDTTTRGLTLTRPAGFDNTGLIGAAKDYQPGRIISYDLIVNHQVARQPVPVGSGSGLPAGARYNP